MMPIGRGYPVLQEKLFDSILKSYEQKFRKFSNVSIIFSHKIFHVSRSTPIMPLIFFTRNATLNLPHFGKKIDISNIFSFGIKIF